MAGAIVVGYTATDAGADAAALGARLARSLGAVLHLVIVLPSEGTRSAAVPPERAYEDHIRRQAKEWLEDAVVRLPQELTRTAHVRFGDSFAEGLIAAGEEFDARLIVIGTASGSIFGRHRLGSVASELLHSSTIPVALAPAGTADQDDHVLPRVTAAVGNRAGADNLLDEAAAIATESQVGLRLVSLVPFDVPPGLDTGAIRLVGDQHAHDVLTVAQGLLPDELKAEVEEAPGDTVEDAVANLSWLPGEVVLVGSSRLAQPRRLFLGSTAAKMLHELPVPMIVVPRTRAEAGVR
ncbi:MAG: universal stress protein [Microbacterium sp.]|uniref:Nucleotide-binding universal stress UspA family protein n=1 Tax=Microbacterium natoriense TaxID=284570 RepID=A0AAW8F2C5_9MICO|nr:MULTISPECIES: universal stress protein [Microbacterium]MBW8763699.1 universal stress protein [Microbacterium sp.]MDQ0649269.1 nucleotide-binding universal stress UspA family protein [Microbacterium natoriense]